MAAYTTEEMDALFAEKFLGQKGSHYELAKRLDDAGFVVQMDAEDNERSEVKLPGVWQPNGADIVIGEIHGDSDAEIVDC